MHPTHQMPQSIELEPVECPLCTGSHSKHILYGYDQLNNLPGLFSVVQCTSCGLQRTTPRPSPATIGFYYPDDYGPYKGTVIDDSKTISMGLKVRAITIAKKIFDAKGWALPQFDQPGRMLEIGCASGSFLHFMAQKGWDVEGIEFSSDAATSARKLGYRVDTGAVETIEKPDASFDLLVGWMVVEHLHDPVGSLKKMAQWAKPNGKLAISIPNIGSIDAKLFGHRWYSLHLPNHLFHFDKNSITRILDASGWKVKKITYHRNLADLIASSGYLLRDKGFGALGQKLIDFPERGGRLGALLLFPISFLFAMLGQTGRMTIWAEKKPS